jgi:hypothetical protein
MNRKLDIFEPVEIKKVIDFLKTEKNITNISESSGVSTITTDSLVLLADVIPIYLKSGQIVTINDVNYTVSNVNHTNKTFQITASGLIATKWNLAINFQFGSRVEINEILAIQQNAPEMKSQRFPLIWLFINEGRNHTILDSDFETSLKLAFVGLSKPEYKAQKRLDSTIIPVIQPLVSLFLATIQSPYFATVFSFEYGELKYTDYIRYFYGASDKSEMVLSAPTDAIELELDLTFQNQY